MKIPASGSGYLIGSRISGRSPDSTPLEMTRLGDPILCWQSHTLQLLILLRDGCRLMLPAGYSQKAFGVLMSKLVERHIGIHDVALLGNTFHGRGSASGVRHGRLVDATWRLFLGQISDFDGLIVRSRSSSVETTMPLHIAATGASILAELALIGASACETGQRLFAAIRVRIQDVFDPYRPELYYMRGPGPRWREKQGATARKRRSPSVRPAGADIDPTRTSEYISSIRSSGLV